LLGASIDFLSEIDAIDGVNKLKAADNRFDLSSLQVPDEMPGETYLSSEDFKFGKGLLQSIFTQLRDACVHRRSNTRGRHRFGRSDHMNAFRNTPDACCRLMDTCSDKVDLFDNEIRVPLVFHTPALMHGPLY
jgi:hypothetical protein